ncbi:hypothetical protein BT93_L4142 [Corymbia citriodora subsp. variegata]|uniref:Uncharacterized protein n=1 Tax=Corymbia citriodora subsp. variegata TaxID=360336 RepID=A0A8T0CKL9_CORYI|nr:hypothetical protein BT93_L4142 [Corymbia citriodora subsp. variegata]
MEMATIHDNEKAEPFARRMLATSVIAALGIGAHKVAILSGTTMEPIMLAFFVFIIGKAQLWSHNVRSNLLVGIRIRCTTIIVRICICPVWSVEQLQDLNAGNMDKLRFLLEFFGKYFKMLDDMQSKEDSRSSLRAYQTVLTSKDREETLANLPRREPCHGQFWFRHPWEHHLKIGTIILQCAYKIEVLNSYLHSDNQKMTRPLTSAGIHLANAEAASEELKLPLESGWWEVLLLINIKECLLKISEAVDELASLACFECMEPGAFQLLGHQHMIHQGTIWLLSNNEDETLPPLLDEDITHQMITTKGRSQNSSRNENVLQRLGENR